MKIVGHLTPKVIKAFNLDYKPGEDITQSAQRKKHMEKHRQEFSDFDAIYERIPEIIAHPDYIGHHPDGQSCISFSPEGAAATSSALVVIPYPCYITFSSLYQHLDSFSA